MPFSFKPLTVAVKKFKRLIGISHGRFPPVIVNAKWFFLCNPIGVFYDGDTLCTIMARHSCDLRKEIDSRMKDFR